MIHAHPRLRKAQYAVQCKLFVNPNLLRIVRVGIFTKNGTFWMRHGAELGLPLGREWERTTNFFIFFFKNPYYYRAFHTTHLIFASRASKAQLW
jgi:hypothetical protein